MHECLHVQILDVATGLQVTYCTQTAMQLCNIFAGEEPTHMPGSLLEEAGTIGKMPWQLRGWITTDALNEWWCNVFEASRKEKKFEQRAKFVELFGIEFDAMAGVYAWNRPLITSV
jgi:hypothetical protein